MNPFGRRILIAVCAVASYSSQKAPVRLSFLNDRTVLSETVDLLRTVDCTSDGLKAFKRAVERYNSGEIQLNVSAFPSLRLGFYSFESISQLVAALPHKLCDTRHAYEFNCFDTIICITADQLHSNRRADELAGPVLVPRNATNGEFLVSAVSNAREAFTLAYPSWYRAMTEGALPESTRYSRVPLTAALLRCYTLATATDNDLGADVINTLKINWKRQTLTFPKKLELVLCHQVSVRNKVFCTVHAGILFANDKRYVYIEKAGGSGPFVRLDLEDRDDLLPWLGAVFNGAGKLGYTHHFVTFNHSKILALEVIN